MKRWYTEKMSFVGLYCGIIPILKLKQPLLIPLGHLFTPMRFLATLLAETAAMLILIGLAGTLVAIGVLASEFNEGDARYRRDYEDNS